MTTEKSTCGCGCMGAGPAITNLMEKLGPPEEVRSHFRAARVEILKGLRALIDSRIAHLSRSAEEKGTTVPVE